MFISLNGAWYVRRHRNIINCMRAFEVVRRVCYILFDWSINFVNGIVLRPNNL